MRERSNVNATADAVVAHDNERNVAGHGAILPRQATGAITMMMHGGRLWRCVRGVEICCVIRMVVYHRLHLHRLCVDRRVYRERHRHRQAAPQKHKREPNAETAGQGAHGM